MPMSTPAEKALRAAVAPSLAIPWAINSAIEVQSLSTMPRNPHCLRKTYYLPPFRTGIDRATKGRQIVLPQSVLRYLRAVVVASSLGGSVSHIVLGAGGDAVGSTKPRTLIAPDVGGGHCRTQVGVFSCAFGDAAPPRVSGDIHHG